MHVSPVGRGVRQGAALKAVTHQVEGAETGWRLNYAVSELARNMVAVAVKASEVQSKRLTAVELMSREPTVTMLMRISSGERFGMADTLQRSIKARLISDMQLKSGS